MPAWFPSRVWNDVKRQTVDRSPTDSDYDQLVAEITAVEKVLQPQAISATTEGDAKVGDPVYVKPNGFVDVANHLTAPKVVGFVFARTGNKLDIVVSGKVTISGLYPGNEYYLADGQITDIPPETGWLVSVGVAISSKELLVTIRPPIRL